MKNLVRKLLNPSRGAGMAEYGILIALVALLSIGGVILTGHSVSDIFRTAEDALPDGKITPDEPDVALDYELPPGSMVLAFTGTKVDLFVEKGAGDAYIYWRDRPKFRVSASGVFSHSFSGEGPHVIGVAGDITSFRSESDNLSEVLSFGKLPLSSLSYAFADDDELTSVAQLPGTVQTLSYAFTSSNPEGGANPAGLEAWDTSKVVDFSHAFFNNGNFNGDISAWRVDAATRDGLRYMLSGTPGFEGDLSNWCVEHIMTEPEGFGADFAARKPVWGHCGMPEPEDNPGALALTVNGSSVSLRLSPVTANALSTIFWGDGTVSTYVIPTAAETWSLSHSYLEPGTYQVQVEMAGGADYFKVLEDTVVSVEQWGKSLSSLNGAFSGMTRVANLAQIPSNITSLEGAFSGDASTKQGPNPASIASWDLSSVTSLKNAFLDNASFAQDVSGWDVSNVTDMAGTFNGATGLVADLGDWCVTRIKTAPASFGATNAERLPTWGYCGTPVAELNPDAIMMTVEGSSVSFRASSMLSNELATIYWGDGIVSTRVVANGNNYDFSHSYETPGTYEVQVEMPGGADYFALLENSVVSVEQWSPQLTSLASSFVGMTRLASVPPLPAGVVTIESIFAGNATTKAGANPAGLETWDVSGVTNMKKAFQNNADFDGDLASWMPSAATAMDNMFEQATAFDADVSAWDVSAVSSMGAMFNGATALTADLSEWCVEKIKNAPSNFGAPNAARHPAWGYCGLPTPEENPSALMLTVNGNSAKLFLSAAASGLSTIYWGDGTVSTITQAASSNWTIEHSYERSGTYPVQVEMAGGADYMRVLTNTVTSVDQWSPQLTSLGNAFNGMSRLASVPPLPPAVTIIDHIFAGDATTKVGPNPAGVAAWDISKITTLQNAFLNNASFDQDVSAWDVSKVTNMDGTFNGATGVTADLGDWCVPQIKSAPANFGAPNALRQPTWGYCGTPVAEANPNAILVTVNGSSATIRASSVTDNRLATIYWGDGGVDTKVVSSNVNYDFSHSYAAPGTYQVQIEMPGGADYFRVVENTVTSVDQWTSALTSLGGAFAGMTNVASVPPLPASVKDLSYAFQGNATTFAGPNPAGVAAWDIASVITLDNTFSSNASFDQDISGWDVSKVTNMVGTFNGATGVTSDLGNWCVSQIASQPTNFGAPNALRQPTWGYCGTPVAEANPNAILVTVDGSSATIRASSVSNSQLATIFWGDGSVDTKVVSSNVNYDFSHSYAAPGTYQVQIEMPGGADYFRVVENTVTSVDQWTSALTSLGGAFAEMTNVVSVPPLPASVKDLSYAFRGNATTFAGPIPAGVAAWDVANVTTLEGTFLSNASFDQDISGWNVSKVTNMVGTFNGATGVTSDLGNWCVSQIASQPTNFGAPNALRQPTWGYCGTPVAQANPDAIMMTVEGSSASIRASSVTDNRLATIYWGDGVVTTQVVRSNVNYDYTHTYAAPGTYQVQIEMPGGADYFRVLENTVVSVEQFNPQLVSLSSAFSGMTKVASVAALPASVINLYGVFYGNDTTFQGPSPVGVESWNVSNVINMGMAFRNNANFNRDISAWSPGSATDMSNMFERARSFSQDVSGWNVSNVVNMNYMFNEADAVTADLGDWCVTKVLNEPTNFGAVNVPRLPTWGYCGTPVAQANPDAIMMTVEGSSASIRTSSVTDNRLATIYWGDGVVTTQVVRSGNNYDYTHTYSAPGTYQVQIEMPGGTDYFRVLEDTVVSVEQFNPQLVSLSSAFSGMTRIASVPPLPASVKSLYGVFYGNPTTLQGPNPTGLEAWDVSNVTTMEFAFRFNANFDRDISSWAPSSAGNMNAMFQSASSFNQDISGWDVGNATIMNSMFHGATALTADLGDWCVSKITTTPTLFGAPNASRLPTWGYCGTPVAEANPDAIMLTVEGASASIRASSVITNKLATIYWGDGVVSTEIVNAANSYDYSHTYAVPGTYQVQIEMPGGADYFRVLEDTVVSVEQFNPQLTSLASAFSGMSKLTSVPPLPSSVVNLNATFYGDATTFQGANPTGVEAWDVANVSNMIQAFRHNGSFNRDLSAWNTGKVTSMNNMFQNAASFNQDISDWDVSNVTSMVEMFSGATGFTGDLGDWCVSKVTSAPSNFGAPNAERLPTWGYCGTPVAQDNPNAIIMTVEGSRASFQALPLSSNQLATVFWGDGVVSTVIAPNNTVTVFSHDYAEPGTYQVQIEMAGGAQSFKVLENTVTSIDQFNPQLTSLAGAFSGMTRLASIAALPSAVKNLNDTFAGNATTFEGPNPAGVEAWDVSNVTNMKTLFRYNGSFDRNLSGWNTASAINMEATFQMASAFSADISGWDVSNTTAMNWMFDGATAMTSDLGEWCVVKVTSQPTSFGAVNAPRLPAWSHCGWPEIGSDDIEGALTFTVKGTSASVQVWTTGAATIDWGIDGETMTIGGASNGGTYSKTYGFDHEFTIQITGPVTRFRVTSNNAISIDDWGNAPLTSLVSAFASNTALARVPDSLPATVTSLNATFQSGGRVEGVETWDMRNITNLVSAFQSNTRFTGSLADWCVPHIATTPTNFGAANAAALPAWGYCGHPQAADLPDATVLTVEGSSANLRMQSVQAGYGTIFWGDGTSTQMVMTANTDKDASHTYAAAGTYQVVIDMPGNTKYFRIMQDTVTSVDRWSPTLVSLYNTFNNASQVVRVPGTLPSSVTSLYAAFSGNGPSPVGPETWDTSSVTNMNYFASQNANFNVDVSNWDVSNVSLLTYAFHNANGFTGDLGDWCVSRLTTEPIYFGATNAERRPVWGFCGAPEVDASTTLITVEGTSAYLRLHSLEAGASVVMWGDGTSSYASTQAAKDWDISHSYSSPGSYDVTIVLAGGTRYIRTLNDSVTRVDQWGQELQYLNRAFENKPSIRYVAPIPANDINMFSAFSGGGVNPEGLAEWDVSKVTSFDSMFSGSTALDQDLSGWDVSSATNMTNMFNGSGYGGDLSGWCVANINSAPTGFGISGERAPKWGTCP